MMVGLKEIQVTTQAEMATALAKGQGLTLVHSLAQPKPFLAHLPVTPCLIDWRKLMHPTYPTRCAYVELKCGRV